MISARYAPSSRWLHWLTAVVVKVSAITIVLPIGAHLMGVIYHTFVRRDGLLHRML